MSEVTPEDRAAANAIYYELMASIRGEPGAKSIASQICKIRQAAYAAGVAAERERIIKGLRDDAKQTEVDARRILGTLIKLTPADIDDWAKLVAMQDARKWTPEAAMELVAKNIELGNAHAIDDASKWMASA